MTRKYQDVYAIAKGLAEAGYDVVTGGGPGIMQAANAGHKSAGNDTHSIGLNIKLPLEQEANKFLDIKTVDKVIHFVQAVQEDRAKMEHVCVNYNMYGSKII